MFCLMRASIIYVFFTMFIVLPPSGIFRLVHQDLFHCSILPRTPPFIVDALPISDSSTAPP